MNASSPYRAITIASALTVALIFSAHLAHPAVAAPLAYPESDAPTTDRVVTRIAFGSCAFDFRPQPIWDTIADHVPDLFIFGGDNMYADARDVPRPITIDSVRTAYHNLASREHFARFRARVPILATWDDHDYGLNDYGEELPFKADSQIEFLNFFGFAKDDPLRNQEGIYHARTFGPEGKRVQIILLDTRYHRSRLISSRATGKRVYLPNTEPGATVLGEAQWVWLEDTLKQPADIRFIVSSIQVIAREHRFEKWENHPLERARLFELIDKTNAKGVVILSGDRHHLELSRDAESGPYPIYDLTSSGLNQGGSGHNNEANRHRIGKAFRGLNYGFVRIDWDAKRDGEPDPVITLEGRGKDNVEASAPDVMRFSRSIRLSELR